MAGTIQGAGIERLCTQALGQDSSAAREGNLLDSLLYSSGLTHEPPIRWTVPAPAKVRPYQSLQTFCVLLKPWNRSRQHPRGGGRQPQSSRRLSARSPSTPRHKSPPRQQVLPWTLGMLSRCRCRLPQLRHLVQSKTARPLKQVQHRIRQPPPRRRQKQVGAQVMLSRLSPRGQAQEIRMMSSWRSALSARSPTRFSRSSPPVPLIRREE